MLGTLRAPAAMATLAFALLVGGCAADASGVVSPDGGQVRLAANAWPGSYANVHVAKILLEEELGLDVEVVEIDQTAQWTGLADGSIDAQLEIWPTADTGTYETYVVEQGVIEDLGELGVVGTLGWYLPTYLLDEHPELATWEGLRGNEHLFATAETGASGQLLAADPSFFGYEEELIANLDLDLEVVQSGSETAQLTAVESAIARREPVLFYFYAPHWMHAEHELTLVELPPWTEACEAAPAEERDCAYADEVLFKIATAGLAERLPEAHTLLANFTMTNAWQDAITHRMDVEGQDAADAARWWVDAHADVWRAWLP